MAPFRVLFVDDNPDDRFMAKRQLSREFADLEAVEVGDARSLQDALAGNHVDLVLTDYRLGWTTGLDVFESARERWPHVPVIMITGTEEVAVEAMKRGLDDYIIKTPSQMKRLAATVHSVMERAKAHRRAAEMELRYQQLIETAPAAIYIVDADIKVRYASPYAEPLLGYTTEQLRGSSLSELVPEDQRDRLASELRRAITAGQPFMMDHKVLAADGSVRWVRNLGTPLDSPEFDQPVVQGVMMDITQSVRTARRQQAISEVSKQIAELLPGQRLQGALAALHRYLPFTMGFIGASKGGHIAVHPPDPPKVESLWKALSALYGQLMRPPADSPAGVALSLKAPVVQNDTRKQTYAGDDIMAQHGYLSLVVYPLTMREQPQTALTLLADRPQAFTDEALDLLDQLAPVLAAGSEAHLHWRELQDMASTLEKRVADRTTEIQSLYDLSQRLGYTLSQSDLLTAICGHLLHVGGVDAAVAMISGDEQTRCQVAVETRRPLPEHLMQALLDLLCHGLGNGAGASQSEAQMRDVRVTVSQPDSPPLERVDAVLVEPLEVGGIRLGGLAIAAEKERSLAEDHRRLLRAAAGLLANALHRTQALAHAERSRLQIALDAMREGIVLLDQDDRIVAANPAARRLLPMLKDGEFPEGAEVHALRGVPLDELRRSTRDKGPSESIVGEGAERLVVELSAVPYNAPDGTTGTVLTLRDTSEQHDARERINQQARLAALGQLAGGIAHDFNNILTTMIGLAQLDLSEPNLAPGLRADLEQISQQGQRAAHLVRQILDFGRRSMSQKSSLRLDSFVKELAKLLRRTIPESIAIEMDIPAVAYLVHADPTQIQQLVMNLVANSRDAMPGGGTLRLRLGHVAADASLMARYPMMLPGQYVRLSVEDTGHGMSPDVLARAFEPFFTTKGVGEGSGLGLSQAYGIAKQHDGYIFIESQAGGGTQVYLYLPALEQAAEEPESAKERVRKGLGETILVAEDEVLVRDMTERMLERLGYKAVMAHNGAEALEIYRSRRDEISAVVADMVMPRMGGPALFDRLRELDPDVPVILITGYGENDEVDRLLARGLCGVVQKPFRMHELADMLRQALES